MAKSSAARGKTTAGRGGKSTGARSGGGARPSVGAKAKAGARKGAGSSSSSTRSGKRGASARGKSTSPARAARAAAPGKSARAGGKAKPSVRSAKGATDKRTAASARGAKSSKAAAKGGKVGSSRSAAARYAKKNDFGVPEQRAIPRGRDKTSASGLPRNEEGRSGAAGDRTHGVGSAPAGPGSGSGGDLDADFIGLDRAGGVAQNPASGDTSGPDAATGSSDDFASGGHAKGRNPIKPGTHGAFSDRVFDTVDHSGEDASTVQGGVSADSTGTAAGDQNEATDVGAEIEDAGELSSGEAGGQDSR